MTWRRRLSLASVALGDAILTAFLCATLAYAFWSVSGSGTATASTLTLVPPTGVTATFPNPSERTVHVAWTGHSAPDGGMPKGYFVERVSGGASSPACGSSPSSLLSGATTACDDTGLASGTSRYVVTAVFRTWTAAGAMSGLVTVPDAAIAGFVVVPSTAGVAAGTGLDLEITAYDQYGATFTAYTGEQCVVFTGPHDSPGGAPPAYPAAGACGSGSSVTFAAGVATVPVTLFRAEITAITATDATTSGTGTSASVTVTAGTASKLEFTTQPSAAAVAGAPFGAQPVVTVQDTYGNSVTADTSAIGLAVTGGGATLSCTENPRTAAAGVATFAGCSLSAAGTWTLAASHGSLTGATSGSIAVSAGAASTYAFTTQPSSAIQNTAFSTQPVVAVTDTYGNVVASGSGPVTLTITGGTGTAGAVLTCTANPVATTAGVATFAGCGVNLAGTGYRLTATGSVAAATSAPFSIGNGTPTTTAVYSGSPQSATVGTPFASQLVALVTDSSGSPVPGVTVTFGAPSSGSSGTFQGAGLTATAVTAANGLATSPAYTANTTPGTYHVTASATATTPATFALTNTAGFPTKLGFTRQPSTPTIAGAAFTTQPEVAIQDQYGNTVTTDTSMVALAVTGGSATLGCAANPVAPVAGLATFAGCSMTKPGTYTLTATDGSLASALSSSLTITLGPPTTIAVSSGDGQSTAVNTPFANPLVVLVTDSLGNPVPGVSVTFTAPLPAAPEDTATAAFTGGAGPDRAIVTTNASGLATATTLTAGSVSGTIAVTAAAPGTNVASFSLTNMAGPPSTLAFIDDPSSSLPNVAFGTQPAVAIQDAYGNVVTTSSSSVTLSITNGTGTSGAALTCDANPVATSSGIASFAGCAIDLAGSGYTLLATGTYAAATSAAFEVSPVLTPASLRLANHAGGTRNRLEPGDQLVITYSTAVKASTLCSDWTSDTDAYTVSDATLTLQGRGKASGSDQLLVTTSVSCAGSLNLGDINLGSTKPARGTGTYTWQATVDWEPSTRTLRVTAVALTSTQPGDNRGNVTATYRPSATITDLFGTPIAGTRSYTGRFF